MARREAREKESGSAASGDRVVTSNHVTLDIDLHLHDLSLSETWRPDLCNGHVLSSPLIMEGARWTEER